MSRLSGSSYIKKNSFLRRCRQRGWGLELGIAVFPFLFALVGVLAGGTSLVHFGFSLVALICGIYLFRSNRSIYLGFTLWLWMLTPEIRRLVDFKISYHDQSIVTLAPYLVTALSFFTVLKNLAKFQQRWLFPFGLFMVAMIYGAFVGLFQAGPAAVLYDFLTWALPPCFGAHIALSWRKAAQQSQALVRSLLWGGLAVGAYGLYQFFYLPGWDAYWMINSKLASIGLPLPMAVRVFGPLNAPGPFSTVLMTSLLYATSASGLIRWSSATSGLVAFSLSLVRSSWGGLVLGLIFLMIRQRKTRQMIKLVFTLGVAILFSLPLLSIEPVQEVLAARLDSFSNLEQDSSYKARQEFYSQFAVTAYFNILGSGLGATGTAGKLTGGEVINFDSGVMAVPYVLGWPGGVLYLLGTILMVSNLLRYTTVCDRNTLVHAAIFFGMAAQMIFVNTMAGISGVLAFAGAGAAIANSRALRHGII